MKLDARIQKIATGMSVSDAIESYLATSPDAAPASPVEQVNGELIAIVEVMFLMAAVDGEISNEELAELRASVEALRDMQALDAKTLDRTLEELGDLLAREGWSARLASAASRIRAPEARGFAFQLAAGVAFVDDFVAHAEAAAIDTLAKALELDPSESQRLLREVHLAIFGD
ncbi:MAG: tellurite resistance TerB family protein [Sandaracinaceae bacterium]